MAIAEDKRSRSVVTHSTGELALQLELGSKIIIDAAHLGRLGLYIRVKSLSAPIPTEFKNPRYDAFEQFKRSESLKLIDEKLINYATSRTYVVLGEDENRFVKEFSFVFEAPRFRSTYSIVKGI